MVSCSKASNNILFSFMISKVAKGSRKLESHEVSVGPEKVCRVTVFWRKKLKKSGEFEGNFWKNENDWTLIFRRCSMVKHRPRKLGDAGSIPAEGEIFSRVFIYFRIPKKFKNVPPYFGKKDISEKKLFHIRFLHFIHSHLRYSGRYVSFLMFVPFHFLFFADVKLDHRSRSSRICGCILRVCK